VIDWDFGGEPRHGILRDVPGLRPAAEVSVSSATAPDQAEFVDLGWATRVRVGDPARTVSGRHRYRIQYPLDGVAVNGRLGWNAVGTTWPVEVDGIQVHVVAPFELTAARCVHGRAGSQQRCTVSLPEPGHLLAKIDRLPAGEGATLYAQAGRRLDGAPRLAPPSVGAPTSGGGGLLLPGLLATAAALLAAVLVSTLIRRAGRERVAAGGMAGGEARVDPAKLGSLASPQPTPPPGLTAAEGGVLLAGAVRDQHKVAWLLAAAADGHVTIDGRPPHLTLTRRRPRLATPGESWTTAVLDQAFNGRRQLHLNGYNPRFNAAWNKLHNHLASWQRTNGLWDPAGDRRRRLARLLGGVAATLGLTAVIIGGVLARTPGRPWVPVLVAGAVLAGAGTAALIRGWELRIRTPAGSAAWLQTESFRRFLAECQPQHADRAAERGLLRQYTAWAVALGQLDHWSQTIATSATAAADSPAARHLATVPSASWAAATCSTPAPAYSTGTASSSDDSSSRDRSSGSSTGGWNGGSTSGFSGTTGGGTGGGAGGGAGGSW
jgi:hypothetical protein